MFPAGPPSPSTTTWRSWFWNGPAGYALHLTALLEVLAGTTALNDARTFVNTVPS